MVMWKMPCILWTIPLFHLRFQSWTFLRKSSLLPTTTWCSSVIPTQTLSYVLKTLKTVPPMICAFSFSSFELPLHSLTSETFYQQCTLLAQIEAQSTSPDFRSYMHMHDALALIEHIAPPYAGPDKLRVPTPVEEAAKSASIQLAIDYRPSTMKQLWIVARTLPYDPRFRRHFMQAIVPCIRTITEEDRLHLVKYLLAMLHNTYDEQVCYSALAIIYSFTKSHLRTTSRSGTTTTMMLTPGVLESLGVYFKRPSASDRIAKLKLSIAQRLTEGLPIIPSPDLLTQFSTLVPEIVEAELHSAAMAHMLP